MRVAQILYHTCPLASEEGKESGGANVYVLKLSEELSKLGIQVDMFTRSEDENTPHEVILSPNLRLFHLKAGPEETLPKSELINYIPEFVENLQKFVETEKYDILDCHYYMSGLTALSLLRKQESLKLDPKSHIFKKNNVAWDDNRFPKTIVTFHTLGLIKNLVARSPSELADETRINAEKELVKKFDAIIAPSKNERDYLHFLYNANPKKINIISPGYDPEIFRPTNKLEAKKQINACPEHKIVLFVGRIEPLKGIDSLLYATKIAFEKYDTKFCVFVIGGEKKTNIASLLHDSIAKEKINTNFLSNETMKQWNNDDKQNSELQKLTNLQNSLSLHTSVKFIPQVSQHKLADYYNAADVVVMPSHYESFGLTALEAMACETPVIVTETAGISGILESSQRSGIISAGNPLLLAERINHILENEKYHEQLSEEIKNTIKNLTWGETAKEVSKTYSQILNL
jgi:D-inositol-3-phosphate glycosyltransferase